ncbi:MAG: phosphonate ABC transporter, permease protein PhnE [Caulobacteraceae bacterium]|nr:phosphonate ABC transporter, permease protein PhnE [Caulobacteraceae bacterium]
MTTRSDLIERASLIAPNSVHLPWVNRVGRWSGWIGAVVLFGWMCHNLDLSVDVLAQGFTKLGNLTKAMLPPFANGAEINILQSLLVTFAMALSGTALAVLLALPLGIAGAKTVIRNSGVHFSIRRTFDVLRAVPVLVWALIMISAFGLGPIAGVIALALADFPHLAKQFAEALENSDARPPQAIIASGGDRLEAVRLGVLPQVIPVMASQSLYTLESNFRHAAILGVVGAGGIGFELQERIRIFAFDQVAWIVLAYVVGVTLLDWISSQIRARLT